MKAQVITLDSGPGRYLTIPAGSYGFYLCPSLEHIGINTYQGELGRYPVRVESPSVAWEPLTLCSAGGFTSAEPLPLLRVVRDWPDNSLHGTWYLVVLDRPGESYQPPISPRLGIADPQLVTFSGGSPEDSSPLHIAPEVRRVTLLLAPAGAPYAGSSVVGPSGDVAVYVRIYAVNLNEEHTFGLVAKVPSATRCYSFEPPCPGAYYLHHESEDPSTVGAVAQLLVEVAS